MAEICTLYISNLTTTDLVTVTSPPPYQMTTWSFPSTIANMTTVGVDVQFYNGHYDEDDGAEQNYALSSNKSATLFDVYATSDNSSVHYLSVRSLGASNPQYAVIALCSGSTLLGASQSAVQWGALTGVTTATPQSHTPPPYEIGPITTDGMSMAIAIVDLAVLLPGGEPSTYFAAIKNGNLTQTQSTELFVALKSAIGFGAQQASWMTENWGLLWQTRLSSVCMPGTHDAGMSLLTASTSHSDSCNTQTQSANVFGQLNAGSRYFDFRPCAWPNLSGLYLCHYSSVPGVTAFGSAGQSLSSALQQVVAFFQQFTEPADAHELVILKFSHFGLIFHEQNEGDVWLPMTAALFTQLVTAVQNQLGGYLLTAANSSVNLNEQELQNLSGSGNRVMAVFDLGTQGLGDFPYSMIDTANGIFGYQDATVTPVTGVTPNLVVYDNYASSNDLQTMIDDQKSKFQSFSANAQTSFLLSWTLTPSVSQDVTGSACVSDLAQQADPVLAKNIDQWIKNGIITATKKPNVLYLDYIGSYQDAATVVAMQINAYEGS
jgi:hypothetical protein